MCVSAVCTSDRKSTIPNGLSSLSPSPFLPSFSFLAKVQPTLGYDSLDITSTWQETLGLIQGPSAVLGATQTGDLDILNGELVVIGNFLIHIDVLL